MTTITLWLLIATAGSYRPATLIERFHTEQQCAMARDQLNKVSFMSTAACIRAEVAR